MMAVDLKGGGESCLHQELDVINSMRGTGTGRHFKWRRFEEISLSPSDFSLTSVCSAYNSLLLLCEIFLYI